MKKYIVLLMILQVLFYSCKEAGRGQYPIDDIPPGKITSVEVENIEGGAIISYTNPVDNDLLYVKANYVLDNGTPMEVKSSVYETKLTVVGIGKSRELAVKLTAVDRSQNESEPVAIMAHPLDAPIYSILNNLTIQNDFGGILLKWANPMATPVVITALTTNEENKLINAQVFYTESKTGKGNVRGYAAVERVFAVFIHDRWGNSTDTISASYLPIYEVQLDKSKFAKWNPPGIPYDGYTTNNWWIQNSWDGTITKGFANLTKLEFTFDMGQLAKLSRFKFNQRGETTLCYALGHPKRFELWGSATSAVNQDFSTWQFLGYFESIKPSGLPLGQVSNEDITYAYVNGEEWTVDLAAPKVRYMRFVALETWGQSNAVQFMEMTYWGSTN